MLVQQDAPQIIRDHLRPQITHPVRTEVPDGWGARDGPVVTVVGDGTPHTEQGWTRENVRIAVYAADSATARDLATTIDAYLLNPRHVRGLSIYPGTGLITARDQTLGCWIAAVTVRAATNRKEVHHA